MPDRNESSAAQTYICTVYEMEERFGPSPRPQDACSACGAGPSVPHAEDCPWLLWARSPVPGRAAS